MKVRVSDGRRTSDDWAARATDRRTGDSVRPRSGITLLVPSNSAILQICISRIEACPATPRLREKMFAEDRRSGTGRWGKLIALAARLPRPAYGFREPARDAVGVRYSDDVVCERVSL